MMRIRLLAAASLLLAAPLAAQQPSAGATYDQLLARVQAGDTTVDFTALRMAYAASPRYQPYAGPADAHADSVEPAIDRNDFRRAVAEADAALASDFLDLRTHLARGYALAQLGDSAASRREHRFVAGMIRSIAASGKGSEQSPYVVVSVAEEYTFLRLHGYRPADQSLGKCGAHPCDVMDAVDEETGRRVTFFFDVNLLREAWMRGHPH